MTTNSLSLDISHQYKSQNYDTRDHNTIIDTIIIHYTNMSSCIDAIMRLCDINAKVSAHYVIERNGKIYNLINEIHRAWHAGESYWSGREKLNNCSIGIELDNNGTQHFSDIQMQSLILLVKNLMKTYPINPSYILGHSDIAPNRKADPGRLFDWKLLYKENIGIQASCNFNTKAESFNDINLVQKLLKEYGYKINITGIRDAQTEYVIRAFCDHFYPENINNEINTTLVNILEELLLLKRHIC